MKQPKRDQRSYSVSFSKIQKTLGFHASCDIEHGINEMFGGFDQIKLTEKQFESEAFNRLNWIQALMDKGKVNRQLFWI
jgi:hypothetical protein